MEAHIFTCFIQPVGLCLLDGAFNPFTFKVIVNMYDSITIFFSVLSFFFSKSFPSLVFPAFCLSLKLLISQSNLNKSLAG